MSSLLQVFGSFLFPVERTDFILTILEGMTHPRVSDTKVVARVLDMITDSQMEEVSSLQTDCPVLLPSRGPFSLAQVQGLGVPDSHSAWQRAAGGKHLLVAAGAMAVLCSILPRLSSRCHGSCRSSMTAWCRSARNHSWTS